LRPRRRRAPERSPEKDSADWSVPLPSSCMTHSVSIALATYNGARFLPDQLESFLSQTLAPAELVACDDGSVDGTWEILEAFAERAPFPVRIHRNENTLGFGDNFLKAALLCTSSIVAFSDQDDVWLPGKLARLAIAFEREEIVFASHSARLVGPELRPSGGMLPHHRRFEIRGPLGNVPLRFVLGFSSCFRRDLLEGVPIEERPRDVHGSTRLQAHDQLIPFLANVLGSAAYLPEVLALYRRHGATTTGDPVTGAYRTGRVAQLTTAWGLRAKHEGKYRYRAELAQEHAEFCRRMAAKTDGRRSEQWSDGADLYDWVRRHYHLRAELLESSRSVASRIRLLRRMVMEGLYNRPWRSGSDLSLLAKDAVFAMLSRPSQVEPDRLRPSS